ncbi:MAG: hypothetical protein FWD90_06735 [Defluviitaleaceae bacterium]|nr:hypothetical protein [Defluviitaleaceae bacterium]
MDKTKKEPLTHDTIIGSKKITAAEFRKFFKLELRENYEEYPLAWSVIKTSSLHKNKSLREIINECLNPKEILDTNLITSLSWSEQKKVNPVIEDAIPEVLSGDEKRIALGLAEYFRENKMKPFFHLHNTWKGVSKGKIIYSVLLINENKWFHRDKKWLVRLWLDNISKYTDVLEKEKLNDFIFSHYHRCVYCKSKEYKNDGQHPKTITILGKEVTDFGCWPLLWVYDPNDSAVEKIKWLIQLERNARYS